jgi:hypothetical protein
MIGRNVNYAAGLTAIKALFRAAVFCCRKVYFTRATMPDAVDGGPHLVLNPC